MGSNPTPRTKIEPREVTQVNTLEFGLWLIKNRRIKETTVERKIKALKTLLRNNIDLNSPNEVVKFLNTTDLKAKGVIRDSAQDYLRFRGLPVELPKYKNECPEEMYIPNPNMVKQFLYRVRDIRIRTRILIAIETGATASEVWRLTWRDINLENKTIMISGVKGHKSMTYTINVELVTLLMQIPKTHERVFPEIKEPEHMNDSIKDYRKRLAKETGNSDFLKIHFHTFRHYAISWKYFKCKCPFETQRFARHWNILNTQKYVHIIKTWVKETEMETVYAETKEELSKYLNEGYTYITKTEWGYCLTRPKPITLPS